MNTVLNGYTHYFNKKYNRKGPLWEGRFRRVLVTSDEQLMYLTRYVHLNPVIAGLVNDPGSWEYSSYAEYMQNTLVAGFCDWSGILDIKSERYRSFIMDGMDYYRCASLIQSVSIDQDTTA
jgi:putative transposase